MCDSKGNTVEVSIRDLPRDRDYLEVRRNSVGMKLITSNQILTKEDLQYISDYLSNLSCYKNAEDKPKKRSYTRKKKSDESSSCIDKKKETCKKRKNTSSSKKIEIDGEVFDLEELKTNEKKRVEYIRSCLRKDNRSKSINENEIKNT